MNSVLRQYQHFLQRIQSGQIAPFYFFYGEELYFIEKLVHALVSRVVPDSTREFNYDVLTASDTTPQDVSAIVRSYPMLGEKRLVLLQHAEKLGNRIHSFFEQLLPLIENPIPTTVLVVTYFHRNLPDQRRKWVKTLLKKAEVFESKPLYENQLEPLVQQMAHQFQLKLTPEAIYVLIAYIGNNLYKLEDELTKLKLFLHDKPQIQQVDQQLILEFTNLSKEFNIFELINSLGIKNGAKSYFILEHLLRQTQEYALGSFLANLFHFFSRLLFIKKMRINDVSYIQTQFGLPPRIAKSYLDASKHYSFHELEQNIRLILQADLKLKGVNPSVMDKKEVFRDLIHQLVR